MKEIDLSQEDKLKLKQDIKISLVFALLFFIALVLIVAILPGVLYLLGKHPTNGFETRALIVLGLLFLPFVAVSWNNILKYIDLKRGKKLEIKSDNFEIRKEQHSVIVTTKGVVRHKIEIYEDVLPLLNTNKPVRIEIAILSKTLLFISQDSKNLIN